MKKDISDAKSLKTDILFPTNKIKKISLVTCKLHCKPHFDNVVRCFGRPLLPPLSIISAPTILQKYRKHSHGVCRVVFCVQKIRESTFMLRGFLLICSFSIGHTCRLRTVMQAHLCKLHYLSFATI